MTTWWGPTESRSAGGYGRPQIHPASGFLGDLGADTAHVELTLPPAYRGYSAFNLPQMVELIVPAGFRLADGGCDEAFTEILQGLRASLLHRVAEFLGDTLMYQDENRRTQIHHGIREVVRRSIPAGAPLYVLAQSLGGVIAYDLSQDASDPLGIEGLITFGSQASFFEVIRSPYKHGESRTYPKQVDGIQRRENLWHISDIFAFRMGDIFQLSSGQVIVDRQTGTPSLYPDVFHDGYWQSDDLASAIWDDSIFA